MMKKKIYLSVLNKLNHKRTERLNCQPFDRIDDLQKRFAAALCRLADPVIQTCDS